jgi:hypothetical protein
LTLPSADHPDWLVIGVVIEEAARAAAVRPSPPVDQTEKRQDVEVLATCDIAGFLWNSNEAIRFAESRQPI